MRERDLDMSDVEADAQRMADEMAGAPDASSPEYRAGWTEQGKLEQGTNEILTALQEAGYQTEDLGMGVVNVLSTDREQYVATITISRTEGY